LFFTKNAFRQIGQDRTGAMQFAVMLYCPSSSATARHRPITALFVEEYAPRPPSEAKPITDEIKMMRPNVFFHPGHQVARERHAGSEIQLEDAIPIFIFDLIDRLRHVAAGVVHQDVDLAEGVRRAIREAFHVFAFRHVGDKRGDAAVEPLADFCSAVRSSSSWRLEMTTDPPASAKPRAIALPMPLLRR